MLAVLSGFWDSNTVWTVSDDGVLEGKFCENFQENWEFHLFWADDQITDHEELWFSELRDLLCAFERFYGFDYERSEQVYFAKWGSYKK